MDMIGKVRHMRLRDQLSLSEIAKRTGQAQYIETLVRAAPELDRLGPVVA